MTWRSISALLLRRADWREDVSAYMDDELSPRERQRVERRLAESPDMQEYLADLEEMRTVLRSFEPEPSAVPFQLTTTMLDDPARASLRPASTARALRLSMSTAAVGVATFAAVMVFDAIDSPSVNFTTTSAGVQSTRVPTAAVVTDEVQVQVSAPGEAQGQSQSEPESAVAEAAQEQEAQEEVLTAASVSSDQAQPVAAERAAEQQQAEEAEEAVEQAREEPAPAKQAEGPAVEEAANQAASDPSRRALTAGRGSGSSDGRGVNVERVVAEQEEAAEAEEIAEDSADSEPQSASSVTADQQAENEPAAVETASRADQDDQQAGAETETRSVATSVARGESDWPLEQRPRSPNVQLATDPSWELPVQIVLAAIAISATVFWLVLTVVDRRRRA